MGAARLHGLYHTVSPTGSGKRQIQITRSCHLTDQKEQSPGPAWTWRKGTIIHGWAGWRPAQAPQKTDSTLPSGRLVSAPLRAGRSLGARLRKGVRTPLHSPTTPPRQHCGGPAELRDRGRCRRGGAARTGHGRLVGGPGASRKPAQPRKETQCGLSRAGTETTQAQPTKATRLSLVSRGHLTLEGGRHQHGV